MFFQKFLVLFCIFSLGCSKGAFKKPYAFVELRLDGREESVQWQDITGNWDNSTGRTTIEASGYGTEQCTVDLEQVTHNGNVQPLNTAMFYFTDGVDLKPFGVSGVMTITDSDSNGVTGRFDLFLDNNYNGATGKRVYGEFGVVNRLE